MPVKPTLSGRKRANQLGQVNPKTDKTDQLLALKQAHEQEDLALGIPDGVETQVKTVKKTRETAADHPVEKFDPQKSAERIARTYQKRQKQGTPNKLAFSPAQQYQFVMDEMKKLMLDKAYHLAQQGVSVEKNQQQCQVFVDQLSLELGKRKIR